MFYIENFINAEKIYAVSENINIQDVAKANNIVISPPTISGGDSNLKVTFSATQASPINGENYDGYV